VLIRGLDNIDSVLSVLIRGLDNIDSVFVRVDPWPG
jgi:hypothetical protein